MIIEGSINELPSGKLRSRIHIGNGKYKSFTADSKPELKAKITEWRERQKEEEKQNKVCKLSDIIEEYIASNENVLSETTLKAYRSYQKVMFPDIMNRDVYNLTNSDYQKAVSKESRRKKSPKTIRNYFNLVSVALKHQCNIELVVNLPRYDRPKMIIPTTAEMKLCSLFIAAAPHPNHRLY